jgi:hypothetical protein
MERIPKPAKWLIWITVIAAILAFVFLIAAWRTGEIKEFPATFRGWFD